MKFGQLTEFNLRNIFSEKSYTKWVGETSSRLFSEKPKLSVSLDQYFKVLYSLFLLCIEDYRNILLLNCIPLAFTSNKAFKKNKKISGTSLSVLFSA